MRPGRARTFSNYRLWRRPPLIARRGVARTLSVLGLKHPWVVQRRNPTSPRVLEDFRLFAIVGTWMEADVIEATVKNAFTQGCERVFLVDNESPDDTVEKAVAAGAELVCSFSEERFDIELFYERMNELVSRISLADGSEHIWWLWLDADEFPHGPRGLTVRDYLATLDRSFRIVGARFMNHYPGDEPHYVSGFHPLDFQPLCEELSTRTCWQWHRKHPLQRFDRGGPEIRSDIGFHRAFSDERPLLEPTDPIFVHHFPFRRKEVTFRRLEALFAKSAGSAVRVDPQDPLHEHIAVRRRSAEAVYAQDWRKVEMTLVAGCRRPRVEPHPWTELVAPEHVAVKRWYSTERVAGGVEQVPSGLV
jgi:Glycosyl transferase family 2